MSGKEEKILEAIKALGRGSQKTFVAVVEDNYPDKDIVDVRDLSGTMYIDVRKRAAVGNPCVGILITPAVGSSVLVSRIGDSDELFIEMFSEIESIKIDGGQNDGIVKVVELTKRLNAIETSINQLKNVIKSWTPPAAPDGGAALKALATSWSNERLEQTQQSALENEKIKH